MIDLHCHILPRLDDGPATLKQSLAMAAIAETDGITRVVATPHVRQSFPTPSRIITECQILNNAIRQKGYRLEILPGAEAYAMADPLLLKNRTINFTQYILIEFPLTHLPLEASQIIFNLLVNGFKPIIAHPERIPSVIANPQLVQDLLADQVYVQLTAGSLTGRFGSGPKKCARYLLKKKLAHFIASDAHAADDRRPVLSAALKVATRLIGSEAAGRLVLDNPRAVLAGEDIDV